jgi:hypothetical protein
MSTKTQKIIEWVLTGLVAFIFLGSAANKLMASPEALKMASGIGLDQAKFTAIAIVELLSIILFIIPRTGVLGTLLLVAYMGGAIAVHLSFGQPLAGPIGIAAFVWIVAVYRFPELRTRLFNK